MSPEEKTFLLKMDVVQKLQEQLVESIAAQKKAHEYNTEWNRKDRLKASLKKKQRLSWEVYDTMEEQEYTEGKWRTGSAMIFKCEQALKEAGRVLGFNARFKVEVHDEDKLRIIPKNGSAQRMMLRYEELFMERELSDD